MANEPVFLGTEQLKLKRLNVCGKIITATITVLFASILVAYSIFSFKLQEAKAETDNRQAEINKNIATETASLESENLKLERFKVWEKIITVTITVLFGSVLVAYINYSFQKRQLKQQKLIHDAELELQNAKADADRRQAEMKYLGDFITYALADDHEKRLRFADYFATLTISPELQSKWKDYRDGIIKTMNDLEAKKIELAAAQKEGGKDKVRKLEAAIERLNAQLAPLQVEPNSHLSAEKVLRFLLDENWKPRNYIENKFEEQKDGKVIYDRATYLMWQQSGSEKEMEYNEADNYISQLNQDGFAGYSDWRLPTLKEAITLLKPEKSINGFFIDPVFDNNQPCIWTSNLPTASSVWVVDFNFGFCDRDEPYGHHYVRAVR